MEIKTGQTCFDGQGSERVQSDGVTHAEGVVPLLAGKAKSVAYWHNGVSLSDVETLRQERVREIGSKEGFSNVDRTSGGVNDL
jgi:hypothetical protein